MELTVIKAEQPIINVNFEEIKASLDAKLDEYKNIVVTEDTLKGCKFAQKELASLRIDVDNNRKRIKKELSEPIAKFEDKCKELVAMIDKVEAPLKEGIKVFDDKKREEKRQIALQIIKEEAEKTDLEAKYIGKVEVKDKYMNLTATESDVREDIISQMFALKAQQDAEKDRLNVIQGAIDRENERLATKMVIGTFMYEIEMGRPTSDILDSIAKRAEQIYLAEHPATAEVKEEVKEEATEAPKEEPKEESLYSVSFTITGSAAECRKVSSFLKEIGITYTVNEQRKI